MTAPANDEVYHLPLDAQKAVDQARHSAEYWKAEHLAGNTVIDVLRAEVQVLRAECDRLNALVTPDYCVSDTEVAGKILRCLGFAVEPSLEPGADWRRDRVAQLIRAAIDAAALLPKHGEGEPGGGA